MFTAKPPFVNQRGLVAVHLNLITIIPNDTIMNNFLNPIQTAYKKHVASKADLISKAELRLKSIQVEVKVLHAEETSLEDMLSRMNH